MQTYEEIKRQLMDEAAASATPKATVLEKPKQEPKPLQESDQSATGQAESHLPPAGSNAATAQTVNKPMMIVLLVGAFLATVTCVVMLMTMDLN